MEAVVVDLGARMKKKDSIADYIGGPVASLLAALAAIIISFLYSNHSSNREIKPVIDLAMTILVGFNFYIAVELFMRLFLLRSMKSALEENNEIAQKGVTYRNAYMTLSDKLLRLSRKDDILYKIGISLVENFTVQFHVSNRSNRIRLAGKESTIFSFTSFWDELIDMQIECGARRPITALVTHVDGIDLYSRDPISLKLIDQQKDFVNHGGRIFRILVEHTGRSQDRNVTDYISVLEKMAKSGINTSYMNTNYTRDVSLKGVNYDIFIIPGVQYSFEWSKENGLITGCCMSRDENDYYKHERTWNDLIDKLKSYDYRADNDVSDYVDFLEDSRSKFIQAYETS